MMKVSLFISLLLYSTATLTLAQECLPDDLRVDCHPDPNATPERCLARGCISCPASIPDRNTPTCFFPPSYGYSMVGDPINTGHGFLINLQRKQNQSQTLFGNDVEQLVLEVDFQSDYRLRVKISDKNKPRWEVPLVIDPSKQNLTDNPLYSVEFSKEPSFSFKIIRKSSGAVLLDTSLGGFVFSDQFIKIGFKLPSQNVYGVGENEQHSLRHSFENRPLYSLWARG